MARRIWFGILVTVVLGGGYWLVWQSPWLTVKKVTVTIGAANATAGVPQWRDPGLGQRVAQVLPSVRGQHVVDVDTESIGRLVSTVRGVGSVEVRRGWPDGIVVAVTPAQPIAFVRIPGRMPQLLMPEPSASGAGSTQVQPTPELAPSVPAPSVPAPSSPAPSSPTASRSAIPAPGAAAQASGRPSAHPSSSGPASTPQSSCGCYFGLIDARGVQVDARQVEPSQWPQLDTKPSTPGGRAAITVLLELPQWLRPKVRYIRSQHQASADTVEFRLLDGRHVEWGSADDSGRKADVLRVLLSVKAKVYDVSAPEVPVTRG